MRAVAEFVVDIPVVYHKHIHTLMPAVDVGQLICLLSKVRGSNNQNIGRCERMQVLWFHDFFKPWLWKVSSVSECQYASLAFGSKACLNRDCCISVFCFSGLKAAYPAYIGHIPDAYVAVVYDECLSGISSDYVECAPVIVSEPIFAVIDGSDPVDGKITIVISRICYAYLKRRAGGPSTLEINVVGHAAI